MLKNRLFYVENMFAYRLVLLTIGINTLFLILNLNARAINAYIGIYIMANIAITLTLFLMAVKVKVYSSCWSKGCLFFAVFSILRILVVSSTTGPLLTTSTIISYIVSAILMTIAYVSSTKKNKIRNEESNG